MDTTQNWALWRFLMIAVIALPFLAAALLHDLRKQRSGASVIDATPVEKTQLHATASTPISGSGPLRFLYTERLCNLRRLDVAIPIVKDYMG